MLTVISVYSRAIKKILKISVLGIVYRFRALCLGPTNAPRVLIVVAIIEAYLWKSCLRLVCYLNDWLTINKIRRSLLSNRNLLLSLLFRLGYFVKKEKLLIVPVQKIKYIGRLFHLRNVQYFLL